MKGGIVMDNNTQNVTNEAVGTLDKRAELKNKSLDLISEINKVPGFSPEALSEKYLDEKSGTEQTMLSLKYKKAWFRMVYPSGRIESKVLGYNEESRMVEAKAYVFADISDEHPIGEGHVFTLVDPFANNKARAVADATLLAEGSAKSRALYEAGFGLQFYRDSEDDEVERQIQQAEVVETSLADWQAEVEASQPNAEAETELEAEAEATPELKKARRTAVSIIKDCNEMLLDIKERVLTGEASIEDVREDYENLKAEIEKQAEKDIARKAIKRGKVKIVDYDLETLGTAMEKVEEVESAEAESEELTVEDAMAFACTHRLYAGKTLGDVYKEKPRVLPTMFERSDDVNEKAAIKTIIQSDDELVAFCERNGKTLVG